MLIELAERCEKATGPDRELDGAIWLAVFADGKAKFAYDEGLKISKKEAAFRLNYISDGARYTASLDAAMTLVPEGLRVHLNIAEDAITTALVDGNQGCAATPALALCAAALRARAGASHEGR